MQIVPMTNKRIIRGNRRQTRAYIGLSASVGDRVGYVQQAMQLLKDVPLIKVIECSSLYETQSWKEGSSAWCVNAASAIETDLSALELSDVCKDIQSRLVKLHGIEYETNASRIPNAGSKQIIDLEILFFGSNVVDTEYLKIPHPMIDQKAYALVPLLEIAPQLIHPRTKKSVAQLHEELAEPEPVFLYGTRDPGLG